MTRVKERNPFLSLQSHTRVDEQRWEWLVDQMRVKLFGLYLLLQFNNTGQEY